MTVLIDLDCRLVVGVDFDCDAAIQHITYHYLIDTAYSLITPRSGQVEAHALLSTRPIRR